MTPPLLLHLTGSHHEEEQGDGIWDGTLLQALMDCARTPEDRTEHRKGNQIMVLGNNSTKERLY